MQNVPIEALAEAAALYREPIGPGGMAPPALGAAPLLIGLASPVMGSGKSTIANHLRRRFGFHRLGFAWPLKSMFRALLKELDVDPGLREAVTFGDKKEAPLAALDGKTGRHAMQTLGTEWGRKCMGEDFWVNITMRKAETIRFDTRRPVVIDDVRFPNEFEAIQAAGGHMLFVDRPDAGQDVTGHASEGALDGLLFDAVITNDGTLSELYATSEMVLNRLTL